VLNSVSVVHTEPAVSTHLMQWAIDHTSSVTCHSLVTHLHRPLLVFRRRNHGWPGWSWRLDTRRNCRPSRH